MSLLTELNRRNVLRVGIDWKGFAELLGLAAVVGGIIFLGL